MKKGYCTIAEKGVLCSAQNMHVPDGTLYGMMLEPYLIGPKFEN